MSQRYQNLPWRFLNTRRELAQELDELEQKYERHDAHVQEIFEAVRQLIEQPVPSRRQIDLKHPRTRQARPALTTAKTTKVC